MQLTALASARPSWQQLSLGICLLFIQCTTGQAAIEDALRFDDRPLAEKIVLPDWFKLSFLDLKEDINEAVADNKRGIIIYFGQSRCPYCKALLENNWGQKDILSYTLKHFDVIAINIRGQREVTDLDGATYSEKQFAIKHKTNFTPSLIFIDAQGRQALRLRGYRPPYQFRAALEYVADGHYKKERFSQYMARAEAAFSYGGDTLNSHERFLPPPYALDRSHTVAQRPLLVSFERSRCHACDVLHAEPLHDPRIRALLQEIDAVQLDIASATPVITPDGKHLTARQWAQALNLDYTPTLIFFDEHGKEIIRIDSVVWFYRLNNVMNYVINKGYLEYPTFQAWRQDTQR